MDLVRYAKTYKIYKKFLSKWACINCVRLQSTAKAKTKAYSHTILSPKTDFPTRPSNQIKEQIQKTAQFTELYNWQRKHLNGPEFVLQDGPPYANGDLHMGHAVNKIIKDISNRSQVLQGNKVHYIPGWDCHGLPIELKALQKAKKKMKNTEFNDPVVIRETARKFALETVESQKAVFKSWGIMANWDDCYLTLSKGYVQNQLRQFYKMYEKGLVFRALKPVYWSPSSKTALAEAELEYDPQHKSTEVYVSFPIQKPPVILHDILKGKNLSAIIWTTTPWTLVANKAICYNPLLNYSIVSLSGKEELFMVSTGLVDALKTVLDVDISIVFTFEGHHLEGTTYTNKLVSAPRPFLPAPHVTETKGTGLVHTAPAHGPDDFVVALKNHIDVDCKVDESGCYTDLTPDLNGLHVLSEGQELVITKLEDQVLKRSVYVHSYPLDWRTKRPVILRASDQWFIDTGALKERALAVLDEVAILPPSTSDQCRQSFRAQVEKRPYWCISRQRAWGVPIPALYHDNNVVMDKLIVENICQLIDRRGPDAWWTSDVTELIPNDVITSRGLLPAHVRKGQDILDIWFDSGISWSTIDKQASLYSEGVDQLTGWFQSSLLTSVAVNGRAPYKSIFVHGFVVDEMRRKMSKSIGNVIDPKTIVNGGKDKTAQPAYGVDTLRWWVASHSTQHSQIIVSKNLLDDCQTEVIRIRNILKYLLGVISDLPKEKFHQKIHLNCFDEYLVHESQEFVKQIYEHYQNFRFNYVTQSILHFISNKVSGLYCHCIKDRLYCSQRDSQDRVSAQLVLHTIFVSLSKALGPILPHLVEEAWQHHRLNDKPFHCTQNLPILTSNDFDVSIIDAILEIKRGVNVIARNENLKKLAAEIKLSSGLFLKLKDLCHSDGESGSVLCEILELASVNIVEDVRLDKYNIQLSVTKNSQCLRCRKYNVLDNSDKCTRCDKVLALL